MNNPMQTIMSMMRTGGSPAQILQSMAQQDPRVGQAMQMIQGKSPQELRSMAENVARERGIDLNALVQNLAQQFGMR